MSYKGDNKYSLRWSKKIKALNMLGDKCKICGEKDIFVLQFDHIKKKGRNITDLLKRSVRWSQVEQEISKCRLLCANCHHEHHRKINNGIKENLLKIIGKDKCQKCGYAPSNISSLCFHHVEEKKFEIGWSLIRTRSYPIEKIIVESEKCEVLCANCHIKAHVDINRFKTFEKQIYSKVYRYKESKPINREEVLRLHAEGESTNAISRRLGHSRAGVWGVLKKYE